MIRDVHPGSGFFSMPGSGSRIRIQGSKKHWLPDPETTKLILLDSLLQEIKSWGAQLKKRQNENTA
jgi:hypothetical protein